MKTVQRRYVGVEKRHPEWSTYICFADAVRGQGFCKDKLVRHFNKLVDVEDYDKTEKKAIIKFLLLLTNEPRGTKNGAKHALRGMQGDKDEYINVNKK